MVSVEILLIACKMAEETVAGLEWHKKVYEGKSKQPSKNRFLYLYYNISFERVAFFAVNVAIYTDST